MCHLDFWHEMEPNSDASEGFIEGWLRETWVEQRTPEANGNGEVLLCLGLTGWGRNRLPEPREN